MKVIFEGGEFDLGTAEATPTISLADFSRRVTDDFGVTRVVPRGFSRRVSVRLALPSDTTDAVHRKFAELRATPAQWIVDEQSAWLNFEGIYRDFEIDLALPPLSYCTLSLEGLAEAEAAVDPVGDPAAGGASTLRLIQPVDITPAALTASNIPETDHPEWSAGMAYATGARVIKAATHRVYESLSPANQGNDPAAGDGYWLEVGATNRWAMFDEALGSSTAGTGSIVVTLDVDGVDAVALLDVEAATVRVQTTGYNRIVDAGEGAITFLDLPLANAPITVTITGTGAVSVGTLLVGRLLTLGKTEASPKAGITDFSRKEADEFGEVTIVERAWAKRMEARALIRTDAIDLVADRLASVRARPALWIGDNEFDSLTIYGFSKDWSIERGVNVSTLTLSVEGLSKAAPLAPPDLDSEVLWEDITGPGKPEDDATVGAPPGTPVGDRPAEDLIDQVDDLTGALPPIAASIAMLEAETIPAIDAAMAAANDLIADADVRIAAARARADAAFTEIESEAGRLDQRIDVLVVESGEGNDPFARSEIVRVENAAASADTALAQQIGIVSASIGPAINAKAQEITTAYAAADLALAERATSLEARTSRSNSINRNPAFSDWPEAQAIPANWASAGGNRQRVAGVEGPNGLRFNTLANGETWGVVQDVPSVLPGYYVVEVVAEFIAGNWAASGIYLEGLAAAAPAVLSTASLRLRDTRSIAGAEPGVSPPPGVYRFAKLVQLAHADIRRIRMWVFGQFPSWGNTSAYVAFHRAAIRSATPAEIRDQTVLAPLEGTVSDAVSRLTSAEIALTDGRFATAQRATAIEASVDDAEARIAQTETAVSDGRFAAASRATALEAQMAGTQNSGLRARIVATETAVTDGRFAAATRVDTLEAEYDGTAATVNEHAGAITGLAQRTAAYWTVEAVAAGNRAQLRIHADANSGAGVDIIGDFRVSGSALFNGTLIASKFVTDQGVDLAALIPGQLNTTVSAAQAPGNVTITPGQTNTICTTPAVTLASANDYVQVKAAVNISSSTPAGGNGVFLYRVRNGVETFLRNIAVNGQIGMPHEVIVEDLSHNGGSVAYRLKAHVDASGGFIYSAGSLVFRKFFSK